MYNESSKSSSDRVPPFSMCENVTDQPTLSKDLIHLLEWVLCKIFPKVGVTALLAGIVDVLPAVLI